MGLVDYLKLTAAVAEKAKELEAEADLHQAKGELDRASILRAAAGRAKKRLGRLFAERNAQLMVALAK